MHGVSESIPNRVFLERDRPPGAVVTFALMVLMVFGLALKSVPLSGLALALAAWVILAHLPLWGQAAGRDVTIILVFASSMAAILPLAIVRSEVAILHFSVLILTLGSAFVTTRDLTSFCCALRWLLWSAIVYVAGFILINGVESFPLDRILPNSSSNGITSGLVLLQASYSAVHYLVYRKPQFIAPTLTFLICLVGVGRGSILTSGIILIVNALSFISLRYGWRALAMAVIVTATMTFGAIRFAEPINDFIAANTKIGAGFYDYHRERMIRDYLAEIDAVTLLTGADYRATSIEYDYNDNPHNAFIRAHHIFGLPYLLAVLVFPLLFVRANAEFGRTVYALSMLGIIYLRAFTEPIIFPTLFDYFFFAACFALSAHGSVTDTQ
ncbi:MAG: hypothetical protein ACR2QV_03575 [Gammaproteobacteria bacterium]